MQCSAPRPSAAERSHCEASLRDVGSPLPVPWHPLSPRLEDMFSSCHLSPNSHPNLYLPKDASTCMAASIWAPPTPSSSAELSSSACPSSAHGRPSIFRLHPPSLLSARFPRSVLQSLLSSVSGSHLEVLILTVTACHPCPDSWNRFLPGLAPWVPPAKSLSTAAGCAASHCRGGPGSMVAWAVLGGGG